MAKGKGKAKSDTVSADTKSSLPNPNLFFGNGEFVLPNGDTYAGDYCAHRFGLIWREGHGIYTTKDGQTYEGEWRDDKLIENTQLVIKFPSGEEYHGSLLQEKYSGGGHYTLKNKMDISCEFFDNKPKGNVVLVDINGRIWEGQAGENKALLLLENGFFSNISATTGVGKLKDHQHDEGIIGEDGSQSFEQELSDHALERVIFAKSTKTAADIDFGESKWWQRYHHYLTMKNEISRKQKEGEGLTEEETKWSEKYEKFKLEQSEKEKEKKLAQKQASVVDTSLVERFYSKEFKDSCPPVKVFHPSCDWAPDCYKADQAEQEEEELKIEELEQEVAPEPVKEATVKMKKSN